MNTFKELLTNSKIFDDNERNLELEFKVWKEEKFTETVAPKDDNLEFVLFLLNKFNEKLKKQSENLKNVEETKNIYKEILENQKNFINDKYSLSKEQLDNIFKKAELSEVLNVENKNVRKSIKDLENSIIKKDIEIKILKTDITNFEREKTDSKDLFNRFKEVLPKEVVRKLQSENLSFSKIKILEEKKLADDFLKIYIDWKTEKLSTINKVDLEFIQKHCETNKLLKEFTLELSEKKIIDLMTFSPSLFQEKREKEMEKVEKENVWTNKISNDKSNSWGSKVNNDKSNEWER